MARLDPTGVSRILSYIKTWVTNALGGKANSSHSHTKSQITDFPTIPSSTSQLTNDSGFLTSAGLLPIGSYIQFAGSQAPAGFLVCNGGAISRTTYSELFAVIGTTYGSGDGSTTFNLPNLTDRFLQGSTTSGTVKNAGLPNITGYFNPYAESNVLNVPAGGSFYWIGSSQLGWGSATPRDEDNALIGFDASRSSSIYGNSTTVQPPALTCLICIKY